MVYSLCQTIHHFFPTLFEEMRKIEDYRKGSTYDLAEIITAALVLFLFKSGSRNKFNNYREEKQFRKNYLKIFKLKLPHMDTVDNVLRHLPEDCIETLKKQLVSELLKKKVFCKYRFLEKWLVVAIDGTGVMSFDKSPDEQALYKTYKSGKKTYFYNVLEAKLLTPNGFAISLASEWIENPKTEYDKQDCERKAFTRLAEKLKKQFPNLSICLVADGLYPYQGFFDICQRNHWQYILTFKDGVLPSVWEEVNLLKPLNIQNNRHYHDRQKGTLIEQQYNWVNQIDYHGHEINWVECIETRTQNEQQDTLRFVHISSVRIEDDTAKLVSDTGRMRFKIENEGFNTQKNQGYEMQHKFSQVSYQATKNYYQCLQIAHMINQLLILSQHFQERLIGKVTISFLWLKMIATLLMRNIKKKILNDLKNRKIQIRFIT